MQGSGRWVYVAALIVGGAIGLYSGASIHYQSSVGGLGGALSAGFALVGLAAVVVVSGIVAVIAALIHRTGISVAAAAFAGGLVAGGVLGSLIGPTYRAPTTATGTVKVVLTEPTAIEWSSRATCTSIENGSAIATVSTEQLTRLDDETVWLRLALGDDTAVPPGLEIGQPLDEDRTPPYPYRAYSATGTTLATEQIGEDRRSGTIRFTDLALAEGPTFPLAPPAAHLAGHVEWTCELSAGQGGPNPNIVGRLDGQLSMTALGGGFGVAFQLEGECTDADRGLSYWTGRATATNGQELRGEIQLDGDTTSVALYLDPDAKDTPYRIRSQNGSSPGKESWGFLEAMQTSEFGALKVIGEWRCRP